MKTFIALVICLALTGVASAEQHKKKKDSEEGQAAAQGQVTAQGNNPQKGKKTHHQIQASSLQNVNAGPGGGPHLQSKKFSKKHTDGQLQATGDVNANANVGANANANLHAMKHGKKFQAKQFKLANKANPNIPAVQFQAGNHIQGANKWKGQKYVVFKNYQAQWHDKGWWHQHHHHIVFVLGGWYFWDGGYFYPAWGYAPDSYYAFDGPIYTGSPEMDPGQVVANVQSALQEQGFYGGEVDGVLGPLTRAALAKYQETQGFEPTGAIDEPTLESLGMV